ncbi:MAG: hypothetical protein NTY64_09290 [Deltaproteobacteria bacterium]|nr:hypothetical protein [Deltaproteobacteria bacterium]
MHCILRRCGVLPSTPHSSGIVRRVPRNAGELFTKPSLWRLFTRSSKFVVYQIFRMNFIIIKVIKKIR